LAPASLRIVIIAIRQFYHFLCIRYRLKRDPAELLRTPKVKNRLPRTLNQAEMSRLLANELSQNRRLFKDGHSPYWQCQYTAPNGRHVQKFSRYLRSPLQPFLTDCSGYELLCGVS
jgi:integrase